MIGRLRDRGFVLFGRGVVVENLRQAFEQRKFFRQQIVLLFGQNRALCAISAPFALEAEHLANHCYLENPVEDVNFYHASLETLLLSMTYPAITCKVSEAEHAVGPSEHLPMALILPLLRSKIGFGTLSAQLSEMSGAVDMTDNRLAIRAVLIASTMGIV